MMLSLRISLSLLYLHVILGVGFHCIRRLAVATGKEEIKGAVTCGINWGRELFKKADDRRVEEGNVDWARRIT